MNINNIVEQLAKVPVLSAVDPILLQELAQNGELVSYDLGQTVVEHNKASQAFFVLVSGRVRLLAYQQDKEYLITTLKAPAHFGEEALLAKDTYRYTVRAADNIIVFRIPAPVFSKLLQKEPELKAYFTNYLDEVAIQTFLKLCTLLTSLTARQIKSILDRLKTEHHKAGDFIFRQGQLGDAFYILRRGRLAVVKEQDAQEITLRELNPGDFFGELALLYDTPRTASVKCLEDSDVFRLSKHDFEHLVEQAPEIRNQLIDAVTHYQLEESLRKQWGLREDLPQYQPTVNALPPPEQPPSIEKEAAPPKPPFRLFGRYPFLRQQDQSDCGAACLAMILRYWGKRVSISRLRDLANVSREGASLLSVAEAAEELGFTTRGLRTGYDTLVSCPLPGIAHWQGNHYIVVYRATPKYVLVADPALGLKKIDVKQFNQGWTGYLLLLTPTPNLSQVEEQVTSVRRFLPLLKPFRAILAEIFLATLLLDLLGLATPIFTQTIVDRVLTQQSLGLLNVMALGMVIIIIFQVIISVARQYLLLHCSNRLDLSMLIGFYRHLLGLPLEYFEKRKIGDFIARFQEAAKIRRLLTGTAITTILDSLMVTVYLSLMFYYNSKLTWAMLAFVPPLAILTWSVTPKLRTINREIFAKHAQASSYLIESISGIHTVKSLSIEKGVRWHWEDLHTQALNSSFRGQMVRVAVESATGLLKRGFSLFLLYYGSVLVIRGELTVGQLMAFNALMGSVLGPIARLINLWDDLQETLNAVERLNDVLDSQPEQEPEGKIVLPPLHGRIKFENVSFRYGTRQDKNILSNIDLEIFPGQTVALVGRSGSGKTTLAKLLLGMYPPSEGRILIDGHDLQQVNLRSYRKQIGAVMQDSFLFSGTIKENIALGDPNPDWERIINCARLAAAHDFISSMPLGYETVVGERGISLSGGQRQRIALARALYGQPRLLILDEATSNLDVETERTIQKHLDQILQDVTSLVIAHRLSTVRNADLIVVLNEGVIVETGTHQSLMEKKGLYYYLNSQQLQL